MSLSKMRIALVALTLATQIGWTASAPAEDRRIKIINETSFTIVRFYGSNEGAETWQEDVLGKSVIKPGGSVTVNFDDGSGYCKFDFKVVFSDGDSVIRKGIDVCTTSVYRISE